MGHATNTRRRSTAPADQALTIMDDDVIVTDKYESASTGVQLSVDKRDCLRVRQRDHDHGDGDAERRLALERHAG